MFNSKVKSKITNQIIDFPKLQQRRDLDLDNNTNKLASQFDKTENSLNSLESTMTFSFSNTKTLLSQINELLINTIKKESSNGK